MAGFLACPLGRRQFTKLLMATALGGIASTVGAARAAVDPAEVYVTGVASEVMALANSGALGNSLRTKFAALLYRHINLRAIGNYALGTYQNKIPAGKKEEFYRLVSNYSAALFVYYVEDFRGSGLDIMSTNMQGKFITIQSAIKLKGGGREQVRWRLLLAGNGFKVSDVNVKGVWLTISMKDRFSKILSKPKGDFNALFAELRGAESW